MYFGIKYYSSLTLLTLDPTFTTAHKKKKLIDFLKNSRYALFFFSGLIASHQNYLTNFYDSDAKCWRV